MDDQPVGRMAWRAALWHALPISAFVLAIYYYWFGIGDRYNIFLYYHDMGPLYDTSPFGAVTSSRYWMTGLVCGGMVLCLYGMVNWLLGRIWQRYEPPVWWRTWLLVAAPLIVGIPLVTLLANAPALPPILATYATLAAIAGVGLAIAPARMAAKRPWDLKWLAWDGLAIGGVIQAVSLLERGLWMLDRGQVWGLVLLGLGLAGAIVLLLIVTWMRRWRHVEAPRALVLLAAGFCVAYLVWPLIHYLGFTDGYHYITDMDNFFSRQWGFQLLGWAVAGAIAMVATMWRTRAAVGRGKMRAASLHEGHALPR